MNFKTIVIKLPVVVLMLLYCESGAQTLSPNVICTGGNTSANGGLTITSTIGEPIHATLQGANSKLTFGEQQPFLYLEILHLKAFIEGYYLTGSGGQMTPALYNADPLNHAVNECDSVTIELHNPEAPFAIVTTANSILHTDGSATMIFDNVALNKAYYVVLKQRNSVETWSKNPLLMNDVKMRFEF